MEIKKNRTRFNRGTKAGKSLIEKSIERLGCGRSVLADRNGVIIAGNDVYETAVALGKRVLVVTTDADTLVVVQRMDVDADSCLGYELALMDNLAQEKNLDWDADELIGASQRENGFDPTLWNGHSALVKELPLEELLKDDVQVVEKKREDVVDPSMQLSIFDL